MNLCGIWHRAGIGDARYRPNVGPTHARPHTQIAFGGFNLVSGNTTSGFVGTKIACDNCDKKALFVVRAVLHLDSTDCRFCGAEIDLLPIRPKLISLAERYSDLDELMGSTE